LLAEWTIVITETAGVAGSVVFVNATLRDAATGAWAWPMPSIALSADALAERLGSNSVPARGSLSVPGSLQFALPSGGREAVLSVAVQLEDENGHRLTALTQADIR
jgi:hypothetical protein